MYTTHRTATALRHRMNSLKLNQRKRENVYYLRARVAAVTADAGVKLSSYPSPPKCNLATVSLQ